MKRRALAGMVLALIFIGMMGDRAQAVNPVYTVKWVGADGGEWNDPNSWENVNLDTTGNALAILGSRDGSEGMDTISAATTRARNIVIGSGKTVEFYYPTANGGANGSSDLRFRQGTNLTIAGGATLLIDQPTFTSTSGNCWGRMDMSSLTLDNGTFWKKGQPPDQVPDPEEGFPGGPVGGGPTIFGSFNVDNNQPRLGEPVINVDIKNGGLLKNDGQLWFGTDGENTPDTRVSFHINDGAMELDGGDIYFVENGDLIVNADLAFFYDYQEANIPTGKPARPKNEKYEINFTGSGSITTNAGGIWVYREDSSGNWNESTAGPLEYEDLWDMGILKANGLSGRTGQLFGDSNNPTNLTPAVFGDYFSVSGTPGTDGYTLTSLTNPIDTVKWVGGSTGEWNDANAWQNTRTSTIGNAAAILGSRDGSEGMDTISAATTRARNIVIDSGATVSFYYPTANGGANGSSDIRFRQGTHVTVTGGSTLLIDQATFTNTSGNCWGRMDMSSLTLDNGTFWKKGQPPDQVPDPEEGFPGGPVGGGPTIFGSFNVDNNMARLGEPVIKVNIKNGGMLKNDGQLWFGTDGENTADTRVSFTINEGAMELDGGDIYFVENGDLIVNADLAFFYDYQEANVPTGKPARPKDEKYEINFTGPGSITTNAAGIWVYREDSSGNWNESSAGPLEYEDLWDMGILKANGLSGRTGQLFGDSNNPQNLTPAVFGDYFSVSGTPGTDGYILNSLITAAPSDADYNDDGTIDAADYVAWRKLSGLFGGDPAGYDAWREAFGEASPGGGGSNGSIGVPEPGAMLLMLIGFASVAMFKKRSR
jgi:hypothetical protein